MHELSLCRSIARIATRACGGRRVRSIELDVGYWRQVVPQTLTYCWGLVTRETPLEGSVLEINHIPVVIECRVCGASTTIGEEPVLVCPCGSHDVEMTHGDEFFVRSIEVED